LLHSRKVYLFHIERINNTVKEYMHKFNGLAFP
jgi:hypothetical protein